MQGTVYMLLPPYVAEAWQDESDYFMAELLIVALWVMQARACAPPRLSRLVSSHSSLVGATARGGRERAPSVFSPLDRRVSARLSSSRPRADA